MQKQLSEGIFKEGFMRNFVEFTKKPHLYRNFFFDKIKPCRFATSLKTSLYRSCFLVKSAKFAGTFFLLNRTGRQLLIIAVSIVLKGEFANETINYDTKRHMYQFESEV